MRVAQSPSLATARRPKPAAWARVITVALLVIAADWISKQAVEESIRPGEERKLLPGIELVYTHNNGVAFGLFAGAQVYVTVALALVVLAVLLYFVRRSGRGIIWLPAGLLIGGACGNIIDRLRYGSVTDFIKLPLGWPPFNIADAAITIAVVMLVFIVGRAVEEKPREGG